VRESVPAGAGLVLRQRLTERVTGPQPEAAGPAQVDLVTDLDFVGNAESVPECEDDRQQVGVAGPFADAVDATSTSRSRGWP
jgi:hypothetical protein